MRQMSQPIDALPTVSDTSTLIDTMIESLPGVAYFYDQTGRFLRWNRNFETVSGYSGAEIARMHPLDFFAGAEQPLLESRIAEVFAKGESSVEALFLAKDGTATPYFFTGRRVSFNGMMCLVGVGMDITDRKNAEARLVQSELKYRELVEHANSIILRWNSQGHITFLNEFGQQFFGYTAAEIVGRHVLDTIVPRTESQGRDLTRLMEEICAAPESFAQNVNENMCRDGRRVWIAWTNRIVRDPHGRVVELLSIGTDVTEHRRAEEKLRESEERFRELAETIQEVFWITDPILRRTLYVSPAYEKIWGRSCASLLEDGETWLEAVHQDDRERVRQAAQLRETMHGNYDETFRVVRPDGAIRWIHDRAFPVRNAAGEIVRVVGAAEDITDRRQLEEQFHQAQKMEAIGQLAGGVAHDFNNILATILGNVQLALIDTAEEHPARESLGEIQNASLRATSLVQQILAFSRHQPQQRRVIDLSATVREAAGFLRATIPSIVELNCSTDRSAPLVLADATQVYQVIANLCTNAWHALDDQPGRIDVTLEAVTFSADRSPPIARLSPGSFACLTVADSGKGMDAATLERVFEPFFTTKAPGKGTGLGLAVVHGVVQSHSGAITVTSTPGQGTTFTIYFPAATAAPTDIPAASSSAYCGGHEHILYLDDEDSLVSLTTRLLERMGYRVSGFTRAEDALESFRRNPADFDLIITDLNMPGIPGVHFAADLLKVRPDMPIVLCSGHVTSELRELARRTGIREILYKPSTMEELSAVIRRQAIKGREANAHRLQA